MCVDSFNFLIFKCCSRFIILPDDYQEYTEDIVEYYANSAKVFSLRISIMHKKIICRIGGKKDIWKE